MDDQLMYIQIMIMSTTYYLKYLTLTYSNRFTLQFKETMTFFSTSYSNLQTILVLFVPTPLSQPNKTYVFLPYFPFVV